MRKYTLILLLPPCRGDRLCGKDRHRGGFQREDAARHSGAGRGSRRWCGAAHARLYLLHGYSGSYMTWQRDVTDLRPLADAYGMIIACPDGENSWYWDSPLDPASQFETFVSQEFPDWIDAHYPTIPSREGRAVTGLSMGGHGALMDRSAP